MKTLLFFIIVLSGSALLAMENTNATDFRCIDGGDVTEGEFSLKLIKMSPGIFKYKEMQDHLQRIMDDATSTINRRRVVLDCKGWET